MIGKIIGILGKILFLGGAAILIISVCIWVYMSSGFWAMFAALGAITFFIGIIMLISHSYMD